MRLFTGGQVYRRGRLQRLDVAVDQGRIVAVSDFIAPRPTWEVTQLAGRLLTPGFVDVHVHLREPGFFYKETIASGTLAAASGGYTALCAMPNVKPAPDTPAALEPTLEAIARSALVRVYPYGCLTMGRKGRGEMADLEGLLPYVCGFSDDGTGVQEDGLMAALMDRAGALDALIAAHCEVESLAAGGCIHQGDYARAHGLPGIPASSEWEMVARDLDLAKTHPCRYHVCHVSCARTLELIRQAKAQGVDVTCETGPHYLLLCDQDLQDDGRFKMNPPLRSAQDREALVEGLLDGTIDMIATDHAPHSREEKAGGLRRSLMGVVGLETAFPILYQGLVKAGRLPLERLLHLMCDAPRLRFRLPGGIEEGQSADLAVWDLKEEWVVEPDKFHSLGRATPFAGQRAAGRCVETVVGGKSVWKG